MISTPLSCARFFCTAACLLLGLLPVTRAQDTAVRTFRYTFGPVEGNTPSSLIQGADGNFYGTNVYGGVGATVGDLYTGNGTVYRLTPAGVLTVLYAFTGGSDGDGPGSLVQAADGSLYGVTYDKGAYDNGTVFHLTLDGVLTTLYAFPQTVARGGFLIPGSDGNLYGATYSGGDTANGLIYRLTPAGEYTTIYEFKNGSDGSIPLNLVQAADGSFYGSAYNGDYSSGTIFRVTSQGEFKTIYTFRAGDGALPNEITLGRDGNLYGTRQSGGTDGKGTIFRVTPAGELTTLHRFTGQGDSFYPIGPLVEGKDGNFYGITFGDTAPQAIPANSGYIPPPIRYPSTFYRVTPDGQVTGLYGALAAIGDFVQGADGNFYGIDSRAPDGPGTVFEFSLVPHPSFFAGQTPLGKEVFYLGFASGDPFGYYTFLSDPAYVYHFDLGYEYAFDAADGRSGVYLYDFKSQGYFYTSPTYPFPYLYDFGLNTVLYYYPDPNNPGRYNTNGTRYFYRFDTGQIITK